MDFMIPHQWLHKNHMKVNPGKCHYMVIGSRDLSHEIMLNNNKITGSNGEKLLGIILDSKLNFGSKFIQALFARNKCLSQVKKLLYVRSKKLTT